MRNDLRGARGGGRTARSGRALAAAALLGAALLVPGAGVALAQGATRPPADRSSPRRALRHFVETCREGRFDLAAGDLDLSLLSPVEQAEGPELARQLAFVLDQATIDWDAVSDAPGEAMLGLVIPAVVRVTLPDAPPTSLVLTHHAQPGTRTPPRWLLGPSTVDQVPSLYAAHGPPAWLDARLPGALRVRLLELQAWQWPGLVVVVLAGWFGGALAALALLRVLGAVTRRTRATWDDRLFEAVRPPLRFFLALVAFEWLAGPLRLSAPAYEVVHGVRSVLFAVTVAWVCVRLVAFVADTLEGSLTRAETDEAQARGVRTQVMILRRIAAVLVAVVACALILTRFEVVRSVGMSMLASAGIAGIVLGLAAQRSISALLAGIQLSLTQPIRIGDTVIIEGEWGWIEEIHLTYVVVKVWDLRRLVVPIQRFLETPFQNWTKVSPDIMGTVEIYADYATPVDPVRRELERICAGSPRWDRKVCGLQVTAVSPQTITLRALVSSADAGTNWDLRCEVRERLVEFLQRLDGGRYLPRARVDRASHPLHAGGDGELAGAPAGAAEVPDVALIAAAAVVDPPGP